METRAKAFLNYASEKLKEANEELFRPEEDIVSFMVCKNSQFAIENYLKGFLLKNGIDPKDFETIDSLYNECLSINEDFKKVNLVHIDCKSKNTNEEKYCYEVSKVSNCFNAANDLDTFLKDQKVI